MKLLFINMKNKKTIFLILIVLVAAFLRLYKLGSLPISLFGDEIDVGYQAWSLITTGKDYTGHTLPLYIQSLTEWRAPLLMYIVAPFMGIFGPSTMSVRLPVALLGVTNVLLVYFLSKNLYKSTKIALAAAFILAISPWHIHYSRAAFEVTLLLTLLLTATLLFIKRKHFWSLIPFALTFYTYSTANVFTPLLFLSLYLVYRPKFNIKNDWLKVLPGFLLCLPIAYYVFAGPASGRFGGISIFSDQKTIDTVIVTRTEPWVLGSNLEKYFHNKPILYLATFSKNYLTSFSSDFLFLNGDPNYRHSVGGGFGELPIFVAPLFVLGIIFLFQLRNKKESKLVLLWLIFSPIASSLTQGGGSHATRLFVVLPGIVITSAAGLIYLIDLFTSQKAKNILIVLFTSISLLFTISYFHHYASHYKFLSAKNWHYGYEQTFVSIQDKLDTQSNIFINNTYEPSLLRFLFYTKFPPSKFQDTFTGDKTETSLLSGFDGFQLANNIYFGAIKKETSLEEFLKTGDIYVASQMTEIPGDQDWSKETPSSFSVLNVTYDVFGKPLFTVIQKK